MKVYRYGKKTNIIGTEWWCIDRKIFGIWWEIQHDSKDVILEYARQLINNNNVVVKMN